ncbi:MAG: hypothetical protein QOG55_1590 [Acidobacteriaceae bacterium]|jgi:hypothetical protein|nr:hypothetical protein [Acidobacteriaceae bacterium]
MSICDFQASQSRIVSSYFQFVVARCLSSPVPKIQSLGSGIARVLHLEEFVLMRRQHATTDTSRQSGEYCKN